MHTKGRTIEEVSGIIMNELNNVLPEALIVTNGVDVADIVLSEEIAKHICNRMNSTQNSVWIYGNVDSVVKYAFKIGYENGKQEKGENDGEDTELRGSDISEEQE